jgi:2-dehydropantoate 2-reductase
MALHFERGNRLELPLARWRKILELGRQLGVPAATHSLIYAMLKPYIMGQPN